MHSVYAAAKVDHDAAVIVDNSVCAIAKQFGASAHNVVSAANDTIW
jgi:hypothetical protein